MGVEIGQKLSHYTVVEKIGEGGMGEVYRAQDTNLGRDVALKILPDVFADDAERAARFRREARTLASIQHANIASIHDFDEAEGYRFLVMELADGEDLAEHLKRGPIPIDEALGIARQITLGLQAAHDVGIVHRDLKPANVLLAANGEVKILDFGLARVFAGDDDDEQDLKESPTITAHMTHAGIILGTAAYMSPEQARGKRIDRRTDIWAFGCVLFEMLTGQQAFPGDTVSDVIAKIIQGEPSWQDLPDGTSAALRKLLRRCLHKDPNARIHDVADARLDIDEILAAPEPEESHPAQAAPAPARRRRVLTVFPWLAAITLAIALAGILAERPASDRALVQFEVFAPPQNRMEEFSVSPDGRSLVVVAIDAEGTSRLWIRQFESTEMRALARTEGAWFPFWSPDSRSIAFFATGKLKRIDVASETIQTLADAPNGRGGAWSPDDVIVFTPEGRDGLYSVSASGGAVTQLTKLSGDGDSHRVPHFFPDGRHFTYVAPVMGGSRGTRMIGSLDSADHEVLSDGASEVYAPPGFLLFVRESTLMAQRLNADTGASEGQPVPLANQMAEGFPRWGRASFSVSNRGTLAYYQVRLTNSELAWFDRNGRRLESLTEPGVYGASEPPKLSPDGQRIGFARPDPAAPESDAIWVLDLERGAASRITPFEKTLVSFAWSHDGQSVFYSSGNAIHQLRLGTAVADTVWAAVAVGAGDPTDASWVGSLEPSPDGSVLIFTGWNSQTDLDVWQLPLDGQRQPEALARGPRRQDSPRVSRDGRWIAYESDESGRDEIYVRPASGSGVQSLVSTAGGSNARWSRDGNELFYLSPGHQLMVVDVRSGPTFQAGRPTALFDAPEGTLQNESAPSLVAAHGDRFLFDAQVSGTKPPSITVVLNWEAMIAE